MKAIFWRWQIIAIRPVFPLTDVPLKPYKAQKTIFMSDSQLIFPFNSLLKPLLFCAASTHPPSLIAVLR